MKKRKRIALISDIHGNVPALSSVLSDIKDNSVDSIICLGDVATLGSAPSETVKMIKKLECPCIVGNHEEALFSPEKAEDFKLIGKMLHDTVYWCLDKLDTSDMSFLKEFKKTLTVDIGYGNKMLCYHGSPESSIDSILASSSNESLEKVIDNDSSIKIAVGGHTHFQMLKKYKDTIVLNPGSVGCAFVTPPYDPPAPSLSTIAEYAIIEIRNGKISVELKTIDYDFEKFKSSILSSDTPLKEWWLVEFERIEKSLQIIIPKLPVCQKIKKKKLNQKVVLS